MTARKECRHPCRQTRCRLWRRAWQRGPARGRRALHLPGRHIERHRRRAGGRQARRHRRLHLRRDLRDGTVCRHARRFERWPSEPQADYLAPPGYHAIYRTNAVTRHGEHGNAVLTRWPVLTHQHEDVSDHRLEQRGLLHVVVACQAVQVHVIVVHLGLLAGSRRRQVEQLKRFIVREVPAQAPLLVAGDFNDWGQSLAPALGLAGLNSPPAGVATFPSRMPLVQLDYIYARGLRSEHSFAPHGPAWGRFSDHLPLITDFSWPHERSSESLSEPVGELTR